MFEYVPEVGEFIVATADFQASVPGGRPRNIKVNMQMKVRKFNKQGDALVDSHKYSQLLLKVLKSDFNKIEHSENRTLTSLFAPSDSNFVTILNKIKFSNFATETKSFQTVLS